MSMCRPASRKAPASACRAKARRAPNGGPNGDLYIFLSVAEHPIFQRDGHNLHCRAPVSFVTAALGGSIEVPTLDGGRAKVAIPEGTQPGRQFRLKAKGMPVLRSAQRGDLYIEVAVETPVKLSKRQKELLREFESDSQAGYPAGGRRLPGPAERVLERRRAPLKLTGLQPPRARCDRTNRHPCRTICASCAP